MIEELKIIADIMSGVTEGAIYVSVGYLFVSFFQPIILSLLFLVTGLKVVKLIVKANQPYHVPSKYLEIIEKDDL